MELHQLRYFIAVVETGSFSRAAERCGVAQPSLSQQVIKLEKELGHALFDRLGRTIAITEAGTLLFPHASRIVIEAESTRALLMEELAAGHGRLEVGAIPTVAPYLLPCALSAFRSAWPQAELTITEDMTDNLVRKLISAEIDVAIMAAPIPDDRLALEPIAREALLCVAGPDHPLAGEEEVEVDALVAQPFIVLHEVHCLSEAVDAFCLHHQINPQIRCRAGQLSTLMRLVQLGLGLSIVPRSAISQEGQYLTVIPLKGGEPTRQVVAVWNASRRRSRLGRWLVDQIREIAAQSPDFQVTPAG